MMSRLKLLTLLIGIVFVSCNKEDLYETGTESTIPNIVILKERNPKYPLILSKEIDQNMQHKEELSFDQFIGRSYKLGSIDYSNSIDLRWPVIDMNKFSSDYPNFVFNYGLNTTTSTVFSYSNFERYTANSKKTETINGGFSLNLGLFKIGAKKSMKEIFTDSKVSETNRVFGELNVLFQKNRYKMLPDSKKLSVSYLSSSFKELLYNRMPCQLYDLYGGFMLVDFVTGGKAQAFYTGVYTGTDESETKEKEMNSSINASYGGKVVDEVVGDLGSANLGIGSDYYNNQSSSNKISQVELSVRTLGGIGPISSFTAAKAIDSYNIDLSNWSSSLADKSTHSVVSISENGLIPISDLILESNLSKRFKSFYSTGVPKTRTFQEPFITIRLTDDFFNGAAVVELRTRFGDAIILDWPVQMTTFNYANGEPDFDERQNYINTLKDKYAAIYDIKIIGELDITLYNYDNFSDRVHFFTGGNTSFQDIFTFIKGPGVGFDETKLKKFVYNDITYLLSTENDRKVGFSIYDDYILDTYGIRAFVETLPVTTINPENLHDYLLIAL